MTTLRRIDPVSCGLLLGVVMGAVGLIAGGLLFLLSLLGLTGEAGGTWGVLFGVGAILVLPIMYGLFGVLQGLIGAFIYNLAARAMGGIRLELGPEALG